MDEQNKGVGERWGGPTHPGERGYASGDVPDERTAEIRSDIERTRAEMTETMDAIQDRLRPGHVVSRAAESARDATIGRARELARGAQESFTRRSHATGDGGFMERVRENPIPAALAIGSIAWFAFATRRGRPRQLPAMYGTTRGGEAWLGETTISSEVDFPDEEYSQGYEDRLGGTMYEGAERARTMSRQAAARLRQTSRRTRSGLQRLLDSNPLAVGAMAAALGATIGLALPETERENELMGEARESVVDRAKGAAHTAAERVQEAAQAAQKVATEVVTKTRADQS